MINSAFACPAKRLTSNGSYPERFKGEGAMAIPNKIHISSIAAGLSLAATTLASDFGLEPLVLPAMPAQIGETVEPELIQADEPVGFFEGWTRTAELGLDGSSGNTDNLSIRAIFQTERQTDELRTLLRARYLYSEDDGEESENQGRVRGENDWLFPGERYFIFAFGVYEFDEFQDWDTRLQLFTGLGYDFLKERALLEGGQDRATLKGRVGAGATREFGSSDDDWQAEALVGLDFFWQITERNSFAAGTEVFPSLSDLGEFRSISYAAYDVLLSEQNELRLRLGLEHEWDSDPGDAKEHDVKYFLTLLATF